MSQIPQDYQTHSVEHRFGGNGWAVVQVVNHEYVRLAQFFRNKEGDWKIRNQLFLAWNKMLSLELERKQDQNKNWVNTGNFLTLPEDIVGIIQDIRTKVASGEFVVKNTRLVKV